MSQQFPDHFPIKCPPSGAQPTEQQVFRLVDNDPPTEEDFRSVRQISPFRKIADECRACGLSVFASYNDAVSQNEALYKSVYFQKKGLPKKMISYGVTSLECGVTLPTPTNEHPTHLTYWLYRGVAVSKYFTVR